ncbi:13657_t:CDS:2 [Funneliformis mosseae]|uniref:13657_t:CDS:1 n=1 Tax=Funneliformis mosseae TaxID=27381 RepID=A0A9N9GDN5_FUNMO|nr:13657_t:CDS:2 [Funneliformis mosseae]
MNKEKYKLFQDDFKEDCKTIMNKVGFYSDENFKTDDELTKEEIEDCIWPK